MNELSQKIADLDWNIIRDSMHQKGYAVIEELLSESECKDIINLYQQEELYRKTVLMARYRFGLGEYKYFNYPLPSLIENLREGFYPYLAPIANDWFSALKLNKMFPMEHSELINECKANGQHEATVLILRYSEGGFNTLHQDLYGEVFFPIQMVLFLNKPEEDYTGGEFVITQQVPRAQSKAIVLKPKQGDALIFTTNFKPEKGSKGYYRVNMKHGVSEVKTGIRHTLGIIFHDALS